MEGSKGGSGKQEGLRSLHWNERAGLFVQDMVVGACVTSLSKSLLAPLERVKILHQTQSVSLQITPEARYKGVTSTLLRISREQGFWTLWRGNGINLIRYFPTQSLNFAFKDVFKQIFFPSAGNGQSIGRLDYALRNMASGGAAGATALLALYPLDLARTRITSDIGKKSATRYVGLRDCLRQVYATEGGIRALYRGVGIAMCGIVPYRAVYFGGYDNLKRFVIPDPPSRVDLFFAAQATTFSAQITAYPFDTVRRHMHLRGGGTDRLYTSSSDCIRKIWSQSRAIGFYRGFLASSLRSFGGAISLVLFDEITKHSKFTLA